MNTIKTRTVHTFFADPRLVAAVVFLGVDGILGFPARTFLGAAAFLTAGAAAGFFTGAAFAGAFVVEAGFFVVPAGLAGTDLDAGFEFWSK